MFLATGTAIMQGVDRLNGEQAVQSIAIEPGKVTVDTGNDWLDLLLAGILIAVAITVAAIVKKALA